VVGILADGDEGLATSVVGADVLVAADAEYLIQQAGGHADLPVLESVDTTPSGVSISTFFKPSARFRRMNPKWVVFEPNDEPLWAQIRLNIGAFMQNLFRQGAFQGKSPRDAYFVKCDDETTTQNDIDNGIVNIVVGFAPLKPAEFVILKIQQIAGQIPT